MKKKCTKTIIFYIILIIILIYLVTIGKDQIKDLLNSSLDNITILENLHYSDQSIEAFKEENIIDEIASKNLYSKTLENVIANHSFHKEYLDYYFDIPYQDYSNFIEYLNLLIEKGYTKEELSTFFSSFQEDTIYSLTTFEYNDQILSYLNVPYFKEEDLVRYVSYQNDHEEESIENIITYVNVGIDQDFYTNVIPVSKENADSLTVLVNKYHQLPDDFVPQNLKQLDSQYLKWDGYLPMVEEARKAFMKMSDDARKEGLYILASSTYRSISTQKIIYNNYVKEDGVAKVDTYSARAGYSEHHTGLAVDYATKEKEYNKIEGTKEDAWVRKNAHKYGFILRYPKGKEFITGYKYEPWHLRYLGTQLATTLYEKNLTYEEYLARL